MFPRQCCIVFHHFAKGRGQRVKNIFLVTRQKQFTGMLSAVGPQHAILYFDEHVKSPTRGCCHKRVCIFFALGLDHCVGLIGAAHPQCIRHSRMLQSEHAGKRAQTFISAVAGMLGHSRRSTKQPFTFNAAETLLLQTAAKTGTCTAKGRKFIPSAQLQQLRANRRTTQDSGIRRAFTFQIHRLHRVEVRKWKSMNLAQHLHNPSQWNSLRGMHLCAGSRMLESPFRRKSF